MTYELELNLLGGYIFMHLLSLSVLFSAYFISLDLISFPITPKDDICYVVDKL